MDLSELRYIACESIGDRLYTFGDGQCFQIRKVEKGVRVDPDYRHAIDRVRCGNICISSGIFGDDDLTIIGDFVCIVLDRSMHCIRGRGNWIGRGESSSCVGCISCVIRKVLCIFEKILILCIAGIPGTVKVIIASFYFDDIPCMRSAGIAGDDSCIDTGFKGKTIEQRGISLAYRFFIDQGSVGGVL